MDIFGTLVSAVIIILAGICITGIGYEEKIRKNVEKFVANVNSGKLVVYCYDHICCSSLIDSKNCEILVAGKHAKIKSDAFCSDRFATQCYRAVIDKWYFNGITIFLYVKPMNKASDKWYITKVDNYSIECSHPVMTNYRVYLDDKAQTFRVGETVTLCSKVSKGKHVLWHYEYEIVN